MFVFWPFIKRGRLEESRPHPYIVYIVFFLPQHIEKCPTAVKEAYKSYVARKFEEQGLDYDNEMMATESNQHCSVFK